MRVKLVVNSFPTASETFLFNLVTGLEKKGIEVTVCASAITKDAGLYRDKIKDWSGNIQYILSKPGSFNGLTQIVGLAVLNPLFLFRMIRNNGFKKGLKNFVRISQLLKGKPDIVHFSFSGLGILYLDCLPYLHRNSIKTVVSCRGTAEKVKPLLEPERAMQLKALFSLVDLIHCVSNDMRDGLLGFGLLPQKTFVNYPSIETGKFLRNNSLLSSNESGYTIVTVGRLHFQKGYVYALQSLKILKEKKVPFTYHILGEGPDRPMLTYLIQEWGLGEQVILHGKVNGEEVLRILNVANVFLLPSLYEGVSNAALEAMAMELPVISTNAGGMAEVIVPRVNGLVTNWKNPGHMGEQLLWVYENPAAAIEMGKAARRTVSELFSLDRQIEIFTNQYKILLDVAKN